MGDVQVAYYEKQFNSLLFMPVFSIFMIVKYPRLITDAHFLSVLTCAFTCYASIFISGKTVRASIRKITTGRRTHICNK